MTDKLVVPLDEIPQIAVDRWTPCTCRPGARRSTSPSDSPREPG